MNQENLSIPVYLHPIFGAVSQIFLILTLVLYVLDASNENAKPHLKTELVTQIAYVIFILIVSFILQGFGKKYHEEETDWKVTNRKKKVAVITGFILATVVAYLIYHFQLASYFLEIFDFSNGFNWLSVQTGVLLFILLNALGFFISPLQAADKYIARFENSMTVGKLSLLIMIILVPILLLTTSKESKWNLDLNVVVLFLLNFTFLLVEIIFYFQWKEKQKETLY